MENFENTPFATSPTKSSLWGEILTFIVIAVCIVLPFRHFVAEPYIVEGTSMFPTFNTGHYLIVDKLSWKLHPAHRYDVVVMLFPDPNKANPTKDFIKRIIGLPGETVSIKDNVVTIINATHPNGFVADDAFVKFPKKDPKDTMTVTLKDDEYFVMGDNRDGSYDSRYWGPLPASDIIGHPVLRLWPLSDIGFIPGGVTSGETETTN